jgi:CRISPR-associated protein Csx17
MARAVTSLGVRRGIHEFVRYGYQQRNNLATHFAVPLGRFRVPDHSQPTLVCLDDLDAWLPGLHRQARAKEAPARLAQAERRLADALYAVTQHPDEAARWQAVLLALAAVEGVQARGSGFAAGPVPKLQPRWVVAANDGGPELRLALSLALQQGGFEGEHRDWWNTTRRHWLPLDKRRPRQFARSGTGRQARLQIGPEVVMQGRSGIDDAIALVERRLTEASQHGQRRVPLLHASRAAAPPGALAALLAGRVDLDRTVALARALMALDPWAWCKRPAPLTPAFDDRQPDDAWLVLRLALLPWPLKDRLGGEIRIGTDPALFRRLASGDAATAVELGLRRLAAAGIRTAVRAATIPPEAARLWAAALAFPITQGTARAFLRRLDPTAIEKETTA